MTAHLRLTKALREADALGLRLPCIVGSSDDWISDHLTDRRRAALACLGCPVLTECAAAGDEGREAFVWGGHDRGTIAGITRRTQRRPA